MNKAFSALLKRFYYDSRLKYKMIVLFSLFILIPVLLLGFSSYYISQKYLLEAERNSLLNSMNQLNNSIENFYEIYTSKSIMIYNSYELQEILARTNRDVKDKVDSNRAIINILNQLTHDIKLPTIKKSYFYGGNLKVKIYVKNETIYLDDASILPLGMIEKEDWCRALYTGDRRYGWQSNVTDEKGGKFIVLNQLLIDFRTQKDLGVIRMFIPIERIENIIKNNIYNQAFSFFYTDGGYNRIISTGRGAHSGEDFLGQIRSLGLSEGVNSITMDGEKLLVGYCNSDITGWKLIYTVPVDNITGKVRTIAWITMLTIFITLILCVLISTLVSSFVTKRINILVRKTNRVRDGNISVDLKIEGQDEIGQLDENFNRMIDRLNRLIENEYKSKIIVNQTKLELLQEQINPHLLYNTLSMIGMTARKSDQLELLHVINNLINFYRGILNKGKMISNLQAEVDMVKWYIEIIRFVYGLDIDTEFEIEEEILGFYSIKLFLQPIVENAIIHGIRPNKSGVLMITGEQTGSGLRFTVADNGVGMEEDMVEYLYSNVREHNRDKGYGVSNVIKRIKLFFGDEYGVEIKSRKGVGTTVTVTIPKLTSEEITRLFEDRYLI